MDLAALRYVAAEATTMLGTWLMHWYIMPRFPKHMLEGGFLSYPQANTQPDFPKCHTPSSQRGQKGLQSAQHHVNNMRISWWKSAPASAHWFDTWKHNTPHATNPCTVPWGTSKGWIYCVCHPGCKLHPRCTEFPVPELLGWSVDAQQMFSAHAATQGPPASDLHSQQHCTNGWILTAPTAKRMEGNPGNLGHKAAPSREKLRQCPAVITGTAQGNMSKSKT